MTTKIKYTFYPDSITGLNEKVMVTAFNYKEAKKKVLKCLYQGKTGKMLEVCVEDTSGFWGE